MATIIEEEVFNNTNNNTHGDAVKHVEEGATDVGSHETGEAAATAGKDDNNKADAHTETDGDIHEEEVDELPRNKSMDIDDSEFEEKHAHDEGDDDVLEDGEKPPSRLYERLMSQRCTACCVRRCPRCCAIGIGVLVPLGILIAISLAFGIRLCENESDPEFDQNDNRVEELYWSTRIRDRLRNLTQVLPRACFALYLSQQNETNGTITPLPSYNSNASELLSPFLAEVLRRGASDDPVDALITPHLGDQYPGLVPGDFIPDTIHLNVTDFYNFMSECGTSARDTVDTLLDRAMVSFAYASDALTFNWIRCFEGAKEGGRYFGGGGLNSTERSKQGQTYVYVKEWEADREQLFEEKYSYYISIGLNHRRAVAIAAEEAANEATGRGTCELNAPAAGWFWFTVQTTIGYGNTPPTTTGSRAMVYTIGFFAILAFGGVLTISGYVIAYLFDDYVQRIGWHFLALPWVGCIIWATCYYIWMVVISAVTIRWKEARLGETMNWRDGYWFAYISTTTVGLGDFVLEPEGLLGQDLFYFPAMFLLGLVFFAAFIGKFAELILNSFRSNRKGFVDTLLEKQVTWKETFQRKRLSD